MGEVYRAKDTRLDREVAVKILLQHHAGTPNALARFERESKAVAALSHPNIVTIFDCGSENGMPYAVTELLEGEDLADRIQRKPIPWHAGLEIGIAVADALSAAHAKGIIHRDIKPGNIFLSSEGLVKVLDFGLARIEEPLSSVTGATPEVTLPLETPSPLKTTPGVLIGTIHYMSPEQVRGKPADARSDIFSLGCVLYEMVTGTRPFSANTAAETMVAIMNDAPPPIADSEREISFEFELLIRRCMEKEPDERFQTARDLSFTMRAIQSSAEIPRPEGLGSHGPRQRKVPPREERSTKPPPGGPQTDGPERVDHEVDHQAILEDIKKDLSRLRQYGAQKGSEMLGKAAHRVQSQEWLGKNAPKAADRLRAISRELKNQGPGGSQKRMSRRTRHQLFWVGVCLLALLLFVIHLDFGSHLLIGIVVIICVVFYLKKGQSPRESEMKKEDLREE